MVLFGPLPSSLFDEDKESSDDELTITEAEFLQETLVHFVWIEEKKKEKALRKEDVLPLVAMQIPDRLKYF